MSRKEIAYEIGQRIRTLRLSANMTQEELSTKLGHSSRSYISRIESGGRAIGQTEIVLLAKIFEVSPEFILCGTSKETTNRQKDKENSGDDDLKFALFNGSEGITDEMFEEVKAFAAFVKQREQQKGKDKK